MEVQNLQKLLQQVQRSPQGYQVAQELLNVSSPNCRFFGALTFSVVIRNSRNLTEDQLLQLVNTLEHHVVKLFTESSTVNGFIIKKLLSNLLLLFIQIHQSYTNPLLSLALKFGGSSSLSDSQISVLLNFSAIIVEELSREQTLHTSVHKRVFENLFPETVSLLSVVIQRRPLLDYQCLTCLNSWVTYIVVAEDGSEIRYTPEITEPVIQFIFTFFEPASTFRNASQLNVETVHKAITVMSEIFDINPRMLSPAYRTSFRRILFDKDQWGANMIEDINSLDTSEYVDEIGTFTNLVVSFILVDMLQLARTLLSPETSYTLKLLMLLTDIPGIPAEDEPVSGQMLTLWEDLANVFIDDSETFESMFNLETNPVSKAHFESTRNDMFTSVCLIYWKKIRLPSSEVLANSGPEFNAFRSNVADFFIAVYSLITLPFFEQLLIDVVNNLHSRNEQDIPLKLESTIYLLYKIADDMSFYENQCNALLPSINSIYSGGILDILMGIDRALKPTFVRFLSATQFFLKTSQGTPYLGKILDFLFLIIFSDDSNLSLIASRTILTLCQECRENLTEFLPVLEEILGEMLKSESIDNLIRQRLFNAYVSVAQMLKNPETIATTLLNLLNAIRHQFTAFMELHKSLNSEQEDYVISLLSCVNEVGKACQLPEELEDFYTAEQATQVNMYWESDPLTIKTLVLQIVEDFSRHFPSHAIVTEKCCLILRSGIGEPINGPFQFLFDLILLYMIAAMDREVANVVPHIFGLLEKYVLVNYKSLPTETLEAVIQRIFTSHLEFIKTEPDMVLSSVQLFATMLEKSPSSLVKLDTFKLSVVPLALDSLIAQETFILKAASKLWIHLLTLRRATKEDQDSVRYLMTNSGVGQVLTRNLLSSFLSSPRSNLEYYYPVFRNLIGKYPLEFKQWMAEQNADQAFINKLMITRGQRSANEVLKTLWMDVNHLTDYNSNSY